MSKIADKIEEYLQKAKERKELRKQKLREWEEKHPNLTEKISYGIAFAPVVLITVLGGAVAVDAYKHPEKYPSATPTLEEEKDRSLTELVGELVDEMDMGDNEQILITRDGTGTHVTHYNTFKLEDAVEQEI